MAPHQKKVEGKDRIIWKMAVLWINPLIPSCLGYTSLKLANLLHWAWKLSGNNQLLLPVINMQVLTIC